METKGNPVDSVIQYQLHKQSGSGDFECKYKQPFNIIANNVEVTQELIDSNKQIKAYYEGNILDIGDTIDVLNIKPSDININATSFNYFAFNNGEIKEASFNGSISYEKREAVDRVVYMLDTISEFVSLDSNEFFVAVLLS